MCAALDQKDGVDVMFRFSQDVREGFEPYLYPSSRTADDSEVPEPNYFSIVDSDPTRAYLSTKDSLSANLQDYVTLLWVAAHMGNVELVEHLLALGAEVDWTDSCGWTPLHVASLHGHEQVVRKLISAGANPRAQTSSWNAAEITVPGYVYASHLWSAQPLHLAVIGLNKGTAEILISHGANVNEQTAQGHADRKAGQGPTPLHIALSSHRVRISDVKDWLCRYYIEESNIDARAGIAKLLLAHGAVVGDAADRVGDEYEKYFEDRQDLWMQLRKAQAHDEER